MFWEYWKLDFSPFDNVPDPRMYCDRNLSIEDAISEVLFAIEEGNECLAVMVGGIGLGKTLALRVIMDELASQPYKVVSVTNPDLTFNQLLREIVGQLRGSPFEIRFRDELQEEFNRLLFDAAAHGQRVVIIIDEANTLSTHCLQDLRLLTNMQDDDHNLVTIVLTGQLELCRKLEARSMENLFQRVGVYCRIQGLETAEMVREYVEFRMQQAGGASSIFTDGAIGRIHYHSRGVPRLVNKLCKLALKAGETNGLTRLHGELIDRIALMFEKGKGLTSPVPESTARVGRALGRQRMGEPAGEPPARRSAPVASEPPPVEPEPNVETLEPVVLVEPEPDVPDAMPDSAEYVLTEVITQECELLESAVSVPAQEETTAADDVKAAPEISWSTVAERVPAMIEMVVAPEARAQEATAPKPAEDDVAAQSPVKGSELETKPGPVAGFRPAPPVMELVAQAALATEADRPVVAVRLARAVLELVASPEPVVVAQPEASFEVREPEPVVAVQPEASPKVKQPEPVVVAQPEASFEVREPEPVVAVQPEAPPKVKQLEPVDLEGLLAAADEYPLGESDQAASAETISNMWDPLALSGDHSEEMEPVTVGRIFSDDWQLAAVPEPPFDEAEPSEAAWNVPAGGPLLSKSEFFLARDPFAEEWPVEAGLFADDGSLAAPDPASPSDRQQATPKAQKPAAAGCAPAGEPAKAVTASAPDLLGSGAPRLTPAALGTRMVAAVIAGSQEAVSRPVPRTMRPKVAASPFGSPRQQQKSPSPAAGGAEPSSPEAGAEPAPAKSAFATEEDSAKGKPPVEGLTKEQLKKIVISLPEDVLRKIAGMDNRQIKKLAGELAAKAMWEHERTIRLSHSDPIDFWERSRSQIAAVLRGIGTRRTLRRAG
ncbi:MAG: AAA family ATPase [Pseudomonadota bacterium]